MPKKNRPEDMPRLFENCVASANECTGICPTVPQTEEEAESYRNIANICVTARKSEKKKKK